MLCFPEDFFLKETREGFTIDSAMKSCWAAELEVLNEIAKICERHGITWYLAFGSLLGAVRHKGYVPWDDDFDICLKRADYMELLPYLVQELPKGYVVRSPLLESGYPEFHSCIVNSDSISIEPEHLRQFHGCPFVVGIDVFPLDYLAAEGDENGLKVSLFKAAREGAILAKNRESDDKLEAILAILEKQCDVTIERAYLTRPDSEIVRNELASGLWGLANEIAMWDSEKETDRLVMYLDYFRYHKFYESQWFENVEWLPFEGFEMPVPGEYDKVLRATYGDYTIPVRNATLHDYPFYNKQLEQLRKYVKEAETVDKKKQGLE